MKKIYYVFFLALAAISCKDDDGSPNIKGTWIPIEEASTGCDDPDENYRNIYDENGCNDEFCTTVTITATEITVLFVEDSGDDEITFPITIKGSTLTIITGNDNIIYKCKVKGSVLTLTSDPDEGGCSFKGTYKRK